MARIVRSFLTVILILTSMSGMSARADDIYEGPVRAEVVRVVDGDTILVEARPWPGHIIETYVRVRGVDTPELRSSCGAERDAANIAKSFVVSKVGVGETVRLRHISGDKYFGRVVADVMLPDDSDLSTLLLAGGYAIAYDGGRKVAFACPSS